MDRVVKVSTIGTYHRPETRSFASCAFEVSFSINLSNFPGTKMHEAHILHTNSIYQQDVMQLNVKEFDNLFINDSSSILAFLTISKLIF